MCINYIPSWSLPERSGKEVLMIYHLPTISKSLRRHAGWCCGNFFGMPIIQLKYHHTFIKSSYNIQHTSRILQLFCICHISCLMCIYIYICMPYMICIHMKPCIQTYQPPGGLQEISQLSEALYLTSSCTACCTWRRVMGRCIQSHPKCDKQMMIMLDVWWLRIDNW